MLSKSATRSRFHCLHQVSDGEPCGDARAHTRPAIRRESWLCRYRCSSLSYLVHGHRGNNDGAKDDVLHGITNFKLGTAAGDRLHEQRAGKRAENGAATAAETG